MSLTRPDIENTFLDALKQCFANYLKIKVKFPSTLLHEDFCRQMLAISDEWDILEKLNEYLILNKSKITKTDPLIEMLAEVVPLQRSFYLGLSPEVHTMIPLIAKSETLELAKSMISLLTNEAKVPPPAQFQLQWRFDSLSQEDRKKVTAEKEKFNKMMVAPICHEFPGLQVSLLLGWLKQISALIEIKQRSSQEFFDLMQAKSGFITAIQNTSALKITDLEPDFSKFLETAIRIFQNSEIDNENKISLARFLINCTTLIAETSFYEIILKNIFHLVMQCKYTQSEDSVLLNCWVNYLETNHVKAELTIPGCSADTLKVLQDAFPRDAFGVNISHDNIPECYLLPWLVTLLKINDKIADKFFRALMTKENQKALLSCLIIIMKKDFPVNHRLNAASFLNKYISEHSDELINSAFLLIISLLEDEAAKADFLKLAQQKFLRSYIDCMLTTSNLSYGVRDIYMAVNFATPLLDEKSVSLLAQAIMVHFKKNVMTDRDYNFHLNPYGKIADLLQACCKYWPVADKCELLEFVTREPANPNTHLSNNVKPLAFLTNALFCSLEADATPATVLFLNKQKATYVANLCELADTWGFTQVGKEVITPFCDLISMSPELRFEIATVLSNAFTKPKGFSYFESTFSLDETILPLFEKMSMEHQIQFMHMLVSQEGAEWCFARLHGVLMENLIRETLPEPIAKITARYLSL